jgi:hypothetical protein
MKITGIFFWLLGCSDDSKSDVHDSGGPDTTSCGAALCVEGDFAEVSSGDQDSVCTLDSTGVVRCWAQADVACVPPAFSGPALSIVNGGAACVLLESGLVECANLVTGDVVSGSLDGAFTAFDQSGGGQVVCGVDGTSLSCNWDASCGPAQPEPEEPVSVVAGADVPNYGCVMEASGTAYCWGNYPTSGCDVYEEETCGCDPAAPPLSLGPYEQFAPNLCGLMLDGTVECPLSVDPYPIPGAFEQVAGRRRVVAVSSDGTLAYASFDDSDPSARATPSVGFRRADTGWDLTCGIDMDGALWCWGARAEGLVACE